ncbi:AAA family ATPase [Corynebacterium sp. H130]|uniref:AAA family ATPase n=1 Tax=Corynebacterium sp. H130 TaxID=3133444 RepID=UPI0030A22F10
MFIRSFSLPSLETHSYVAHLPVVQALSTQEVLVDTPVTFFVGENGSGKSTLLEALAVAMRFSPEGGSRHANFSGRESVSELHQWLRIVRSKNPRDGYFLRAESMYRAYSYLDSVNTGQGPLLHHMSHGESTMELVRHRFHGQGLYFLDEPESGLSFATSIELRERIEELAGQGAQFLIATHSPILLQIPGARILEISETGIDPVSYNDCELVAAYREFLADPHGTAAYLIS